MKNFISRIYERIGDSIKRFNMSYIWSVILFILLSVEVFNDMAMEGVFLKSLYTVFNTMIMAAVWQVWLEQIGKTQNLILRYSASLAYVLLFMGLLCMMQAPTYIFMVSIGFCLSIVLCGMYLVASKGAGNTLFLHLLVGGAHAVGTAALAALALNTCFFAIHELLYEFSYDWMLVIFYFSSVVLGWNLFLSWIPKSGDTGDHFTSLSKIIKRVLVPIYLFLLLILYMYLGKLLVTMTMPSGQMNWFASLSMLGYTFFYFTLAKEEDFYTKRFLRWGSIALIPIVAVQMYGVYIRLVAYGLTDLRYLSLFCSLFGIITMVYGYQRWKATSLYVIGMVLVLIATLTPFNVIDVPARNQLNRIKQVLQNSNMLQEKNVVLGDLSEEEKEEVIESLRYLQGSAYAEKDEETVTLINSPILNDIERMEAEELSTYTIFTYTGGIPISGWTSMYSFDEFLVDGKITISIEGEEQTFVIGKQLESLLEAMNKNEQQEVDKPIMFSYDENHQFYFYRLAIHKESEEKSFDVRGVLLVK